MHVKVRNKVATIEFESGAKLDKISHTQIMEETIHLVEHGFRHFIFDFEHVDINFNSMISGFIIAMVGKLIKSECYVMLRNLNKLDLELLNTIGLSDIQKDNYRLNYTVRGESTNG